MKTKGDSLMPNGAIEAIVKELNKSPVFQLSLASKELFHSNFLAWLCKAFPEAAGRLFAEFLNSPQQNLKVIKATASRESKRPATAGRVGLEVAGLRAVSAINGRIFEAWR